MKLWFIRSDPARRLRQILGGKPLTLGAAAEVVEVILSDPAARERLEMQFREGLLDSLDLDSARTALEGLAPGHRQQVGNILNRIESVIRAGRL